MMTSCAYSYCSIALSVIVALLSSQQGANAMPLATLMNQTSQTTLPGVNDALPQVIVPAAAAQDSRGSPNSLIDLVTSLNLSESSTTSTCSDNFKGFSMETLPASVTSLNPSSPSSDTRLMFEVAMIANAVNGNPRWKVQDLSNLAYNIMRLGLSKISVSREYSQIQGDLDLVWGPAFLMSDDPQVPNEVEGNDFLSLALQYSNQVDKQKGLNATYLNVMYVARDPVASTYYIGIGGTNSISIPTWILENFQVAATSSWPYGTTTTAQQGAQIFKGTSLGLQFLQTMTPVVGLPGAGLTLEHFLSQQTQMSTVRVAGHSLGGALTPVLALWLQDAVVPAHVSVTANIYAGPTPGNAEFAQYYNSRPLARTTHVTSNSFDIVNHAWTPDTMAIMPTLFESTFPGSTKCMKPIVDWVVSNILNPNENIAVPINPLADPWFNGRINNNPCPKPIPDILTNFLKEIYSGQPDLLQMCPPVVSQYLVESRWQHTEAYFEYLNPVIARPDIVVRNSSNEPAVCYFCPPFGPKW